MKVLQLSSEKGWRGGEQQIAYLLDELAKADVENFVLARRNSEFEQYCEKKKIPVSGVAFNSSVDVRTAKAIKTICLENKIDLVHMHSSKSHSLGVLSSVLGNPVPLILSRRVDFVPKANWFTRWKYNHPAIKKILCVSGKIESIMREYVADPRKCVTVYSGVDLNRFRKSDRTKLRTEFNIPADRFIIGNSSALEDHKDYKTFIRTIEILVKKNLPVIGFIMGSGSLENELRGLVKQLRLEDQIVFTGYRRDIQEILPGLDIFLMTSSEEGLGTSVLDAFVAGVPVVATAAGGIPEMVKHEMTGLVAPVRDAAKLAENIERLITDGELMASVMQGATRMVQNFSKERTAEKTLAQYIGVLHQQ